MSIFLDIKVSERKLGRIVIELDSFNAPLSSDNFLALVKGPLKNTIFHRVIKNFVIQLGDIKYGKVGSKDLENLGKGNESMLGEFIKGENLNTEIFPFSVCMANTGNVDANGTQFFIATHPQPHLLGKHTVFGRVVSGKSVVREIERVVTNKENVPVDDVVISDSGVFTKDMSIPVYNASYDPIGGDVYEEYPDDDIHINKESLESVFQAAEIIKESGTLLFKSGQKQNAQFKYAKSLRYVMDFFPDQDQEPEWYNKYLDLKKKLYLNLSLVNLQLKQYQRAVKYSEYLLDMAGLSGQDQAKGHFRKGSALVELRKFKDALNEVKIASELLPTDEGISRELLKVEGLVEKEKEAERKKYNKFFG